MKIKQAIKLLNPSNNYPHLKDFEISGVSCNSKTVKDNFVFVAIRGTHEDGGRFVSEAIKRGAKAVVIQSPPPRPVAEAKIPFIIVEDARRALAKLAAEFYCHPSSKVKVVGITGTNGKTTISYLIEAILKESNLLPAVIGTVNYRFKEQLIPAKNTTPGPVELQSMLAQMVSEGIQYCLMEVSSHALDQGRVGGIDFHSAIFTNLTQDHLDYHKTLDNYFKAKTKLFTNLNAHSFAVINSDDKYGRRLEDLTKARVVTYGLESNAQVSAENIKLGSLATEFILTTPKAKINLKTKLIGRHNIYNVLAAAAWALKDGIDTSGIKSALEKFSLVPGRLEKVGNAPFSVFVDYAHTEDALNNVIRALRPLTKKKIIVVFGCGGERDKTKRPKMGKTVSELSDYAIITSDNPRSEDPQEIIKDIKDGIKKTNFCVIPERKEAIKKSLSLAKKGDIVLVAGKGHEDYQIFKDKIMHFDDRKVIRECLKSMNY